MRSRAESIGTIATTVATIVVVGSVFAAIVGAGGIPVLRHDWMWVTGGGFFSNSWSSLGGWSSVGIGSPRPYPSDYLLALANVAIIGTIGDYGGFLVSIFAIGAACAAGGIALARRFTDAWPAVVASAAFATFNPWVYNKVVAGHIYMVLAYAAAMLLLAEMSKERSSPFRIGLFTLLTMQQLQFFLPLALAMVVWTLVRRERLGPVLITLLASMPIWIGVLSDRSYLLSIPYTQSWQTDASLDPMRALELSGYFAKYADALPSVAGGAVWVVAAIALAGAVVECFRRPLRAPWLVGLAVALWLFASGTKGVFGAGYLWIVAHVPESGLYRELYDLLGFLAIAYIAASAAAVRRMAFLAWILLPCGVALAVAWSFAAPERYWVASRDLPAYHVDAPANTRYALMPPMQPLSFQGRGDGLDPDAIALPYDVVPLNTPQFSFPESPALAMYAFSGDSRWLRALSVAQVLERPEFQTDLNNLHMQFAVPPKSFRPPGESRRIAGDPELTLNDLPQLSALPASPWENAVFFGDAHGVSGPGVPASWSNAPLVRAVRPSSGRVFAADGWVDVRTAFAVLPQLAQGIGGAMTTNPSALLPVDPALATLVYVDGRLEDTDGRTLAATTHGYRWLAPLGTSDLRCVGLCVVAAQSAGVLSSQRLPAQGCAGVPALSVPASWLAIGNLPASGTCLLRYNVRFDGHWTAFVGGTRLGHVAVDSIVNGWIVPAHDGAERVVMIETVACVQFVFMILAALVLVALGSARAYALVKR